MFDISKIFKNVNEKCDANVIMKETFIAIVIICYIEALLTRNFK